MTGRAVFVAWLTLAATIANGQSTPQKPTAQQPPFRSGANFVRVDVYPTTDGKPVMDLRAEDFEVFEDNAPQSIQSFEHVVVKSAGPQATRTDPGTIGQSLEMAANPRNRVFVLFLDQKFVQVASSWNIRQPLVRMIDEMLGPDDLIGVMTSSMSAADVTLARKTQVLADGLLRFWPWGERYTNQTDERENQYWQCFPLLQQQDVVGAMIARRRERMTLDAFRELTQYLRNIREERKAIVVVS
jgi:VWFA-related protein